MKKFNCRFCNTEFSVSDWREEVYSRSPGFRHCKKCKPGRDIVFFNSKPVRITDEERTLFRARKSAEAYKHISERLGEKDNDT